MVDDFLNIQKIKSMLRIEPLQVTGAVVGVRGLLIEAVVSDVAMGDLCKIVSDQSEITAEVVALDGKHVSLMSLEDASGIKTGNHVFKWHEGSVFPVGDHLLGCVLDGLGRMYDGSASSSQGQKIPIYKKSTYLKRDSHISRLSLGVKSLDAFVPCARGQRIGIFAGAGVGKTTLLAMVAKEAEADVVVMGLIGERGREVDFFSQKVLSKELKNKTVMVVSTSDESAPMRVRAAFSAAAVAEYFRNQGKKVLLFIDSLTRLAMAQREIGLAAGEPPTSKGYPPSVFSLLPKLLEKSYASVGGGSVTGLYTVLVEGDDLADPVADSARSLLDGHIVLSRSLAMKGQYPAVDVLQSLSRLEGDILNEEEQKYVSKVRLWMSVYEDAKDMIAIGAYKKGTDPMVDEALLMMPKIESFLKQKYEEHVPWPQCKEHLYKLCSGKI
jgi:flagellum-specific ATP synthase